MEIVFHLQDGCARMHGGQVIHRLGGGPTQFGAGQIASTYPEVPRALKWSRTSHRVLQSPWSSRGMEHFQVSTPVRAAVEAAGQLTTATARKTATSKVHSSNPSRSTRSVSGMVQCTTSDTFHSN